MNRQCNLSPPDARLWQPLLLSFADRRIPQPTLDNLFLALILKYINFLSAFKV
ncbi:MAG: hypothetical protein OFPII_20270 [Osedax symbiont Rs1]|nr:MAG: hypothetical protein OFPII_20270 [Osedax symbiont Rs1]